MQRREDEPTPLITPSKELTGAYKRHLVSVGYGFLKVFSGVLNAAEGNDKPLLSSDLERDGWFVERSREYLEQNDADAFKQDLRELDIQREITFWRAYERIRKQRQEWNGTGELYLVSYIPLLEDDIDDSWPVSRGLSAEISTDLSNFVNDRNVQRLVARLYQRRDVYLAGEMPNVVPDDPQEYIDLIAIESLLRLRLNPSHFSLTLPLKPRQALLSCYEGLHQRGERFLPELHERLLASQGDPLAVRRPGSDSI